jgi:hypothetical protein
MLFFEDMSGTALNRKYLRRKDNLAKLGKRTKQVFNLMQGVRQVNFTTRILNIKFS